MIPDDFVGRHRACHCLFLNPTTAFLEALKMGMDFLAFDLGEIRACGLGKLVCALHNEHQIIHQPLQRGIF
jgi:hypothetical protein